MITGGAVELAELGYQGALDALNGIQDTVTMKHLKDLVGQKIVEKLNEGMVGRVIICRMNGWQNGNVDTIQAHTGTVLEKLYGDLLPVDAVTLDRNQTGETVNGVNIDGGDAIVDELYFAESFRKLAASIMGTWVRTVIITVCYSVLNSALNVLITTLPPTNTMPALYHFFTEGSIIEFIEQNPNKKVSANLINTAITKLKNEKAEKCKEMQQKIEAKLREFLNPDQLTAYLPGAFRKALNIAVLKSFKTVDNCPPMSGTVNGF